MCCLHVSVRVWRVCLWYPPRTSKSTSVNLPSVLCIFETLPPHPVTPPGLSPLARTRIARFVYGFWGRLTVVCLFFDNTHKDFHLHPMPLTPGLWHLDSNPPPLPQVVKKYTNSVYAMVSRLLPLHPLSQVVKTYTNSV